MPANAIGNTPVPSDAAIQNFTASIRGGVITPTDPRYDETRALYNAMIDKRPALIARCTDAGDVISAVNFAREHGLLVAVRGGGHSGPGLGSCDDGLMIDLSLMKGVRVDPNEKTARVAGGCTWGEVDHATHAFGFATPSGIIASTGVGGLTLGGGLGHLTRKCGLTIDNLLEADVVLADGRFVTASASENQDLFWAIRGGGGNFGVVTSFVFRLHPIDTVYGGPMFWPLDKTAEILRWYRDFIVAAPDDMNGFFAFHTVPPVDPFPEHLHNQKICALVWCYTGALDRAEAIFAPIREQFGPPALDWVGPIPHPALQGMFDGIYTAGNQWYWKADFVNELSDEAIAIHAEFGATMPTVLSAMHLYPIDGAAGRVGQNETAWNYRNAKWGQVMVGVSPDPADNEAMIAWTKAYWDALHPYSAGGAYVNMMMDEADEGQDRVKASYGSNYDRLAQVKTKYDPNNLFRVNQNIKPT